VSENPFEVLQLDPSATEAEIVRQAALLRQRGTDEEKLTAIRQAVQALTARPEDRQLFALLTPPGAVHHWPTLERLEAAFRRPPQGTTSEQTAPAPLDLAEVASLLRPLLARELEDISLPFEPPTISETSEEVLKQTMEGLWQVLPFEPGA
jgi:hypothetical protein